MQTQVCRLFWFPAFRYYMYSWVYDRVLASHGVNLMISCLMNTNLDGYELHDFSVPCLLYTLYCGDCWSYHLTRLRQPYFLDAGVSPRFNGAKMSVHSSLASPTK